MFVHSGVILDKTDDKIQDTFMLLKHHNSTSLSIKADR